MRNAINKSSPQPARRRGFTFIEVMFAVMILGFGVIMIAAMLPVAVRQTQNTRETNAGSAIVESGFHQLEAIWGSYDAVGRSPLLSGGLPATNRLNSQLKDYVVTFPSYGAFDGWLDAPSPDGDGDGFPDAVEVAAGTPANDATQYPGWLLLQTEGNRVESSNARDAWIPFYTRQGGLAPFIALVGVRARNVETFLQGHFQNLDNAPLPVNVELLASSDSYNDYYADNLSLSSRGLPEKLEPDVVRLNDPFGDALMAQRIVDASVDGAVLVLVNDTGQIRILTLGTLVKIGPPNADPPEWVEWTLSPGGDVRINVVDPNPSAPIFNADFEPGTVYRGYLVGRMLRDPSLAWDENANPYVGKTQVVQVLEGKMLR